MLCRLGMFDAATHRRRRPIAGGVGSGAMGGAEQGDYVFFLSVIQNLWF